MGEAVFGSGSVRTREGDAVDMLPERFCFLAEFYLVWPALMTFFNTLG